MAIAQTIVDAALRKCGVNAPTLTQRNNAFEDLNRMIASWSVQRLLVYEITREMFALTIGTEYYNLGSDRRIQLQYAYLRDGAQDYPLDIEHIKDYARLFDKTQSSRPTVVYFLQEPNSRVVFNYKPDKAYQFYFASLKAITQIPALGTTLTLPQEYERALVFNLAVEIAPEFDQALDRTVFAVASDARAIIEGANSKSIDESKFDRAIVGKVSHNILTDEVN